MAKEMIEFTINEWRAKGRALFGDDEMMWQFVCPNCGFVQSANDLIKRSEQVVNATRPFTEEEALSRVYFSCSGRWPLKGEVVGEIGESVAPCNYTAGGLFNICNTKVVVDDEDKAHYIFGFADG